MIARYYHFVAVHLSYFGWGRALVSHLRRHQHAYGTAEALFTALLLVLLIKGYAIEAYEIPSTSMVDTLMVDDRIIVNKLVYRLRDIQVGDVIVFKVPPRVLDADPDRPYYIKRVVGLPGDVIEIGNDGYIYRNGIPLQKPDIFATNVYTWQLAEEPYEFTRTEIPEGSVLVFGDNSADSYDSRYWGPLPIENVLGKVFFRYWPVYPWRVGWIYDRAPSSADYEP